MNGKSCKNRKNSEENIKCHSSLITNGSVSRESNSKQIYSEVRQKENKEKFSSFDFAELKKHPDIFNKLLDTAVKIEKEKHLGMTYELYFSIKYDTAFGERIVVTGFPEFLGNWDPLKGLELEWSVGNVWKVNILIGEGVLSNFEYNFEEITGFNTLKA